MKNLLLLLLFAFPIAGIAQGVNCADMDPICTDAGATYTANVGTTAEVGNDYGCLLVQSNPSWYYFEVATNGAIDMSLSAAADIDFIVYGPYPNLAAAQGDCGTLDASDIVDCSYSAATTETPSIPGGVAGEVYIMMITNYANTTQDLTLVQTGGTGSTDCSIVVSPPCFMSFFEANISACDPLTDTYEITGQIDFEDPPTTGNLIVEDCNGNQVIVASAPFTVNALGQGIETYTLSALNADGLACDVSAFFSADPTCSIMNLAYTAPICNCFFTFFGLNQEPCNTVTNTFDLTGTLEFTSPPTTGTLTLTDCDGNSVSYNAPFASPLNWSITGITPIGTTNCTVTATFSAEPGCTITSLPFNHPADCNCPVDAGTFSTTITGSTTSTGPFALCFGDSLTITPNGDFIPPANIGNPPPFTYNPGMHLKIYDCPPTVFAPADFTTDPCYLGTWDDSQPFGPWGVNNVFGNNLTFYFIPITYYDYVNYLYSYFFTGTLCYDMGPAYPVTFLAPINTNVVEDCFAGTATVTISGGTPANNGSLFNIVPGSLTPASASFVNTSAANGGTITISGLVDGDMYSFEIQDDNECPVIITGTFTGLEDASFFYDPRYCVNDPDALPTITGVPGGTFTSSPAGLSINPVTGLIIPTASTSGVYTITYQSPAPTCFGTETFIVEINQLPYTLVVENGPICDDGISTLIVSEIGGEATEWSWVANGNATFDDDSLQSPTVTGAVNGEVFTVTATDPLTGCETTNAVNVVIFPLEDPTFTLTDFCFGDANGAIVTGTSGGTFSFNPDLLDGSAVNATTGEITNEVAGTTYNIQYLTGGACPDSLTLPVTVNALPAVAAPDQTICDGDNATITATGANTYSWSPGTDLNTTIGATVIASPSTTINYTVTGTDANGCVATDLVIVTVNPVPIVDPILDQTICNGDPTVAINFTSATAGATFNWTNNTTSIGLGANGPGNIASFNGVNNGTLPVTATITVIATANGCPGPAITFDITVNPTPTVDPIADQLLCEGDNTTAVNFTGAVAGTQYDWTNSNTGIGLGASGATDIASFVTTNTTTAAISGTIQVTPTASGCLGAPENFVITVNPLPSATIVGTATVCENDPQPTITFTGSDGVAPYTFTYNINNGAPLQVTSVGNTATINAPTNVSGVFDYNLVSVVDASTTLCSQNVASTATITVNPTPTVNPIVDQEFCEGDNSVLINFTGAVAGTQYDWTNTNTGIGLGATGQGDITPFTGTNATSAPIIGTIEVTPSAAGCLGAAESFTITINPLPNATIAGTVTVCENDPQPTITFTGSDGVAPYTFTYNINNGAPIQVVSVGNTATVLAPTNVSGTFDYNLTNVQDASASACSQGVVSTATVTVNPNPTPVITGVLEYCVGFSATLGTANAYNGYVWSNGGTNPTSDFTIADNPITVTVTDANGCTGTSAAVNVIENTVIVFPTSVTICQGEVATIHGQPQTVAGVYDETFILPTGCDSTSSVTLIVNPLPAIDAGVDIIDCEGAGVTLTAVGAPTIVWDVAGVVNGVQFFPNVGTLTYTATGTDANGCVNTDVVDVTINPTPDVDPVLDQIICNGDLTGAVNFTGSVAGTTYDWVNDTPTIGLVAAGSGDIAAFNAVNSGATPVVATITVTPTANGCPGTPETFTITVNPTPTVDPILDQTVCNGEPTALVVFSSPTAGTSFDWGNNDPSIGLVAIGNGDIASFNAVNNGATPVVATITVTPLANGCPGAPETFTITVSPTPTVDPILDQTVCNGILTAPVVFTGALPGTSYDWGNSNTGIGLAAIGNGDIAPFNATNLTSSAISGTITVIPSLNGCAGPLESFTITVEPPITADPIADQSICVGENTAAIVFTSPAGVGVVYNWGNDNTAIGLAAMGMGDIPSFVGLNGGAAPISGTITVLPTLNGCVGLPIQFTITVNPLPIVDAGADVSVCDGDPVTLTASGADTYVWVPNITNGQPFVPAATEIYTVIGMDVNGCINSDDVLVTVEPLPEVSFTADTTQGCEGLTVTFTNTTPGVFADCFWTFGNGATAAGCGSVTVTFNDAGLFDATLTTVSASGCTNSVTYTDYIYIEDNPIASFSPSSSVVSVFDSEVAFNNTSSGAVNYDWDFGDGSAGSTQENPVHQFPSEEAGGYTVWLIAYSPLGCPDSTLRTITINEELIFYIPNTVTPDNDDFNQNWQVVFSSGYDPYDFNLYVYNRWGELIWESHDASVGWDATYGINGREVQDGTYTWKIDFKTIVNDERVQVIGHVNVLR